MTQFEFADIRKKNKTFQLVAIKNLVKIKVRRHITSSPKFSVLLPRYKSIETMNKISVTIKNYTFWHDVPRVNVKCLKYARRLLHR